MKPRSILICAILGVCLGAAQAQPAPNYDALIQQGKSQLQAGNSSQALASGRQAIQLDATRWEAYALAGGALMNLKRYEEAEDQNRTAFVLSEGSVRWRNPERLLLPARLLLPLSLLRRVPARRRSFSGRRLRVAPIPTILMPT